MWDQGFRRCGIRNQQGRVLWIIEGQIEDHLKGSDQGSQVMRSGSAIGLCELFFWIRDIKFSRFWD